MAQETTAQPTRPNDLVAVGVKEKVGERTKKNNNNNKEGKINGDENNWNIIQRNIQKEISDHSFFFFFV